jgi:hypothetical protein
MSSVIHENKSGIPAQPISFNINEINKLFGTHFNDFKEFITTITPEIVRKIHIKSKIGWKLPYGDVAADQNYYNNFKSTDLSEFTMSKTLDEELSAAGKLIKFLNPNAINGHLISEIESYREPAIAKEFLRQTCCNHHVVERLEKYDGRPLLPVVTPCHRNFNYVFTLLAGFRNGPAVEVNWRCSSIEITEYLNDERHGYYKKFSSWGTIRTTSPQKLLLLKPGKYHGHEFLEEHYYTLTVHPVEWYYNNKQTTREDYIIKSMMLSPAQYMSPELINIIADYLY